MMIDSIEVLTGVSILVVTPALVEVAKQLGLPIRWAGMAAIAIATFLVVVGAVANGETVSLESASRWLIQGLVYGLAASGFYSQTRLRDKPPIAMA